MNNLLDIAYMLTVQTPCTFLRRMAEGRIEYVIPTTAAYNKNSHGDDGRNYQECLQTEEAMHSAWLEKIKISSAENYRAGYLAGSSSKGDLVEKVTESEDVRTRLFETIPAPCKSMNSDTFQRYQ